MYILLVSENKTYDIRAPKAFQKEEEALSVFVSTFLEELKLAGAEPGVDGLPKFNYENVWEGENEVMKAKYFPGNFVIHKLAGEAAGEVVFGSLKLIPPIK